MLHDSLHLLSCYYVILLKLCQDCVFYLFFLTTLHNLWDLSSRVGIEPRALVARALHPHSWTARDFPELFV